MRMKRETKCRMRIRGETGQLGHEKLRMREKKLLRSRMRMKHMLVSAGGGDSPLPPFKKHCLLKDK